MSPRPSYFEREPMNKILATKAFDRGSDLSVGEEANILELYDQAASLAAMGAWSCDIESERLAWTGGVFELFGLLPEQPLERQSIVELYCEQYASYLSENDRMQSKRAELFRSTPI